MQGYDSKINLYKICFLSFCIQNPNCLFITTNPDDCGLTPFGLRSPGNGSFTKLFEVVGRRKALVTGKPNTFCFSSIMSKLGIDKSEILFIGDNLKTDIKFSNSASVDSVLVLTGVTSEQRLKEGRQDDDGLPTYISVNLS